MIFCFLSLVALTKIVNDVCREGCTTPVGQEFIQGGEGYEHILGGNVSAQLKNRIREQPFNLISALIFACAIFHTFFARTFTVLSEKLKEKNIRLNRHPVDSFGVEILHFMGEVEVVFGIWVIPLFFSIAYTYNWQTALDYLNGIDYLEPIFVVVIMALASTGPILRLAENGLKFVAWLGGGSVKAWWWSIMTIGPIAGSFITEPGAMTLSAFLLGKQFYELKPSRKFSYATLGLLFTNISVGGVLTNFAAPPVLMVSKSWGWDTSYMLSRFGWKAVIGILIANTVYYFLFREEFVELEQKKKILESQTKFSEDLQAKIPLWITLVHVGFVIWVVAHNHYSVIIVGTFLLFLGFYQATLSYQKEISLKPPILVGFFLAGLIIHGHLQGWWIEPLLGNFSEGTLIIVSGILTSFNDNAGITFLATLIPSFSESLKYAVMAGAVTGGGLTVIANAPNPTGQSILGKYFGHGISPLSLFSYALFPTLVMGLCFYLLRDVSLF